MILFLSNVRIQYEGCWPHRLYNNQYFQSIGKQSIFSINRENNQYFHPFHASKAFCLKKLVFSGSKSPPSPTNNITIVNNVLTEPSTVIKLRSRWLKARMSPALLSTETPVAVTAWTDLLADSNLKLHNGSVVSSGYCCSGWYSKDKKYLSYGFWAFSFSLPHNNDTAKLWPNCWTLTFTVVPKTDMNQ